MSFEGQAPANQNLDQSGVRFTKVAAETSKGPMETLESLIAEKENRVLSLTRALLQKAREEERNIASAATGVAALGGLPNGRLSVTGYAALLGSEEAKDKFLINDAKLKTSGQLLGIAWGAVVAYGAYRNGTSAAIDAAAATALYTLLDITNHVRLYVNMRAESKRTTSELERQKEWLAEDEAREAAKKVIPFPSGKQKEEFEK